MEPGGVGHGNSVSIGAAPRSGSSASNQQAKEHPGAGTQTLDGYYRHELPSRKSEAVEAQKFLRSMTTEKARKSLLQTKAAINTRFDMIHFMTQEMLNEDGPEHKALLEDMEKALNYNLDVTQQQYARARRCLMEERIKFWKKFKNTDED